MPAAATVPPTEAAASLLPLGATIGPAGLGVMPYSLNFSGNFFQVADFIKGIDSLVKTGEAEVAVDGRLVTIDGFSLQRATPKQRLPAASNANFSVTTYLTPPEPGLTAGATPTAPAPVTTPRPRIRSADRSILRPRPGGAMNMLKKGPELKMPELKVPDFLLDLYYDLRDATCCRWSRSCWSRSSPCRSLLEQVVRLGRPRHEADARRDAERRRQPTAERAGRRQVGPGPARLPPPPRRPARQGPLQAAVHRRADSGSRRTPPKRRAVGSESSVTSRSLGADDPDRPTGRRSPTAAAAERPRQPASLHATPPTRSTSGSSRSAPATASRQRQGRNPTVRHDLPELTMLPSRETPAAIFMGPTKDGKKALMLVSSDVQAIFGDAICVVGSETCQLLALEPGLPETFVYGGRAAPTGSNC